jgi:hypothetical protein
VNILDNDALSHVQKTASIRTKIAERALCRHRSPPIEDRSPFGLGQSRTTYLKVLYRFYYGLVDLPKPPVSVPVGPESEFAPRR